jgi:hypothetical protein
MSEEAFVQKVLLTLGAGFDGDELGGALTRNYTI